MDWNISCVPNVFTWFSFYLFFFVLSKWIVWLGWSFVQGVLLNFYIIYSLYNLVLKLNKSEEPLRNTRSINAMNQVFNKRQNTVKRTQCVVSFRLCSYIDLHSHSEKEIKSCLFALISGMQPIKTSPWNLKLIFSITHYYLLK